MHITQTAPAGLNNNQLISWSLKFRFDEHSEDVEGLVSRGPFKVRDMELGKTIRASVAGINRPAERPLTLTIPVLLEVETSSGGSVSLPEIKFNVFESGPGELVYRSEEHKGAWQISIKAIPATMQLTLHCNFSYSGLNVGEALNNVRFMEALAAGGEFRILKADDRMVLGRARVGGGDFEPTNPRWIRVLEWLVFIQERAGVPINLPDHDLVITHEDAVNVFTVKRILETGRATATAEPWVSISTPEQARAALETFGSGQPAPMALTFENQVVQLFGSDIPLGAAGFLCRETYITEDDLADLRAALEVAEQDSQINVRFTPFEGCALEATYREWLPRDETPTEGKQVVGSDNVVTVQAEPLGLDANTAVALLQSWYDEDAEEQRDTWEKLRTVLGEERTSDRELFP